MNLAYWLVGMDNFFLMGTVVSVFLWPRDGEHARINHFSVYLFICCLCYYAFSVNQTIHHCIKGWYVNDELDRMWKEAVVDEFKVLFQDFSGGTEKTTKKTCHNSRFLAWDLNSRFPEYEAIRPWRSARQIQCSKTVKGLSVIRADWTMLISKDIQTMLLITNSLIVIGDLVN
jgi:hypothetical protein